MMLTPWHGFRVSSKGMLACWRGHRGSERYGYDFEMTVGTAVHAARAGRVIHVEVSHSDGEIAPSGFDNYVVVRHSDGTHALYGHLTRAGASVSRGDSVAQGLQLGRSGNTGNKGTSLTCLLRTYLRPGPEVSANVLANRDVSHTAANNRTFCIASKLPRDTAIIGATPTSARLSLHAHPVALLRSHAPMVTWALVYHHVVSGHVHIASLFLCGLCLRAATLLWFSAVRLVRRGVVALAVVGNGLAVMIDFSPSQRA